MLLLLLASTLAVAVKIQPASADVDWWPMFHHDLNHTGTSTSTGPTTNNTLWTYTTGGIVFSSPAVVGGLVYVGGGGNVYCLNAANGVLVWSYTTGYFVYSSPAVVGGLVYVGSADGNVYCLNAANGVLVWSYTTGNQVNSSPAVVNGVVYVGSYDGKVYAFGSSSAPLTVSISPTSVTMDVGQSQLFTSSVTGGTAPYTYQWYLNGAPVSGATSNSWTFTPTSSGSYTVYLNVTDSVGVIAISNTATVTASVPSVTISPTSVTIDVGQSKQFTSSVSGGTPPYVYQWYLNGAAVSGATGSSWTFTPSSSGSYTIYVNVTDAVSVVATSNTSTVTVSAPTYNVTISAHCNTEGVDVAVNLTMDGSPTGYATPHTFTNLTGTHTFAVPSNDTSGHPFKNWSTGQNTLNITVSSGGTFTAYYQAPSPSTYNVTIAAHCNTEGADVNAAITEDGSSTGFTTPHTFAALTGSHNFTVPSTDNAGHPFLQWSTNQTSTTITVSSGGTFTAYYAEHAGFISVKSQYSGYFLENLKFMNTFSVYTNISGTLPVQVYGILGETNYTFSNPSSPGGPYTASVDMGSLQPNSSLAVSAVYSDGTVLNSSYPLKIIETPSWLISLIKTATSTDIKVGNNTYTVHFAKDFDLPNKFNMNIPLPKFAGGGSFTLLPTVSVEFTFSSDGNFSISCPLTYETPNMDFGAASVKAHVTLSASGDFALQNNTINWLSATLSFEVGASGSVNVPIAGYTFHVPGDGDATIGLTATVRVDANFAASLVLAPTQNASQELISGLEVMIQSISGQITFGLGLALNAGFGIGTITGGGSVDFTVYLKPTQPYVSGGTVTGTVSIKYHVLWWGGTLWSMSGRLYEWGSDPYLNLGSISDFAVMPRYYNTTDYEGFVWPTGVWNGTAIQDIYPFTRMSASSNGDNAYILYTTDNISLPEQSGLSLTGLEFDSSQGALKRLVMPSVSDEIFFDPVVVSLPNGTLLAMWDSVPLNETSGATGPFDINRIIPQYSYFDTETENWSPVRNLTETGVANSYQLSSDSAGSYALVLEGDSIFSTNQYLVEYDVQSDSELLNMSVANVTNIISFNNLSHLAVLQLIDGSYELMNLSSGELVALPSMTGCSMKGVQLAVDSTDSLGILYSNSTSNIFSIYNISSNTTSFSMNVSQSTSYLTLIQSESRYRLITSDSSGITSYFIENQSETHVFYPMQNITSMGATITNDGILVYTTENYGNSSYPLLNLTLTFIPDVVVLNITVSKTLVHQKYSMSVNVTVQNQGNHPETFNVTLNANMTAINQTQLTLASGNFTTITLTWNTTGFDYGNYTMSAYAWPVPSEINTSTNNFICPVTVHVGVPGDVSSTVPGIYDEKVNMKDIAYLVSLFQTKPNKPNWNPNADVNNDGVVDMKDIAIAVYYFNQHE